MRGHSPHVSGQILDLGIPGRKEERGRTTDVLPRRRLALTPLALFLEIASADRVLAAVTLHPLLGSVEQVQLLCAEDFVDDETAAPSS